MSRKRAGSSRDQPSGPGDEKTDFVITPGGPVRRENVHQVEPGGTVVRRDDGSLDIVPAPPAGPAVRSKPGGG